MLKNSCKIQKSRSIDSLPKKALKTLSRIIFKDPGWSKEELPQAQ
jgi:hypothetical protein